MENIPPLYIHERFEVSATRLFQLEKDSKELQRAKILIKRLRAENKVLKENEREWKLEQKSGNCKTYSTRANYQRDRPCHRCQSMYCVAESAQTRDPLNNRKRSK